MRQLVFYVPELYSTVFPLSFTGLTKAGILVQTDDGGEIFHHGNNCSTTADEMEKTAPSHWVIFKLPQKLTCRWRAVIGWGARWQAGRESRASSHCDTPRCSDTWICELYPLYRSEKEKRFKFRWSETVYSSSTISPSDLTAESLNSGV